MDSSQLHRPLYSPSSHEYVDGDGKVRTLITERHPFKGVEKYFTDFFLYSLETDENPHPQELDSIHEADVELETEEECL